MICSLYAAIYGFIYRNRFKEMKFLFVYPAASFVETFLAPTIYTNFSKLNDLGIPQMLINSFLLVEFLVIYHFYLQIFKKAKVRRLLYAVMLTYIPVMILVWLTHKSFNTEPEIFFVPQAICVLVPGFYYFVEIAIGPISFELKSDPIFWIMIGVMMYFGCTLPLFLLNSLLDFSNLLERKVYAINCLCYGLLYLLLIKAYLCKKKKVQ